MIEEALSHKQSQDERQQILSMKRSIDSPFTNRIKQFRPPLNFILPQFKEFFDGRNGDPVEHVQHFQASMSLWGFSDELLCRTFPMTLNDAGESIIDITRRFRQEVSEVGKVDPGLVIKAYKNALDYDEFGIYNSLTVHPVVTLKELYDRADRYGRDQKEKKEKLSRAKGPEVEGHVKQKQHLEVGSKKKNLDNTRSRTGNGEESRRDQGKEKEKFTSINIGLGELFKKVKDSLPVPKPMSEETKDKRDRGKYCAYHRDHGHNTESCRILVTEVQKMVGEGNGGDSIIGVSLQVPPHLSSTILEK
ncbi:uncharacterized protein LOC113272891 [Papaver somniferum]|uniref:uncharacterized protein LOC113272891 n=1 Tax=Papaver somniferum TaxID=3469 RepID=UPI000E702C34|nr:uncharacterized protein LOC113272891 [Papaver somniferum]